MQGKLITQAMNGTPVANRSNHQAPDRVNLMCQQFQTLRNKE